PPLVTRTTFGSKIPRLEHRLITTKFLSSQFGFGTLAQLNSALRKIPVGRDSAGRSHFSRALLAQAPTPAIEAYILDTDTRIAELVDRINANRSPRIELL